MCSILVSQSRHGEENEDEEWHNGQGSSKLGQTNDSPLFTSWKLLGANVRTQIEASAGVVELVVDGVNALARRSNAGANNAT